MKRVLLLDGDMLAYQFGAGAEKPIDWGEGLWTLHAQLYPAQDQLDEYIAYLMATLEADESVIALTDDNHNWRKDILPSYKSNRKERKPIIYQPLREYMRQNYIVKELPGLEADDVLGLMSTKPKSPEERIIVSKDKDFYTIPGKFARINPKGGRLSIEVVTESEARWNHLYQTLRGDPVDGYSGCPGIGEAKATKILGSAKDEGAMDWWVLVVSAYEKAGLTEKDALVQARVAHILQWGDYDFKKNKVKLWGPK